MSTRNKVLAASFFVVLIIGAAAVWWTFAREPENGTQPTAAEAAASAGECIKFGGLLIDTGETELGEEAIALCIKKNPGYNMALKSGEDSAAREFDALMRGWSPPWPDEFGVTQLDITDLQLLNKIDDLDRFISGHSGGYHAKLAVTVKSLALYHLKSYNGCATLLADNASALPDLALYLSALSALKLQNRDAGRSLIDRLLREHPESLYAARGGLLKAAALMDEQNYREAAMTAIEVARKSDDPLIKGEAIAVASKIYRAAGDNAGAAAMIVEIAKAYPAADVEGMLDELIDPATDVVSTEDAVALAEYFAKKKRGFPIIRFLSKKNNLGVRGSYLLAKGYLLNGNYSDADRAAAKIPTSGASAETRGDICVLKGQILRGKGKLDPAASQLKGCVANYKSERVEALEILAKIYFKKNNPQARIRTLMALLDEAPDHEMSGDILLEVARAHLLSGNRRKAVETYSVLASANPPKSATPEAAFWLGKIEYDAGNSSVAEQYFKEVLKKFPYSYYYFRSGDYLKAMGRDVPIFSDVVREKRNSFNFEPSSNLYLLSANALRNINIYGEALRHFKAAAASEPERAAMGSAKVLRDLGRMQDSVKAMEDMAKANPEFYYSVLGSRYLTELLFPSLYYEMAKDEAAANGIDDAWPLAIIRQESRFIPNATSSSNAKGLMQIIPSTGQWIASLINDGSHSTDLLYNPNHNVKYGTWYFKYLLKQKHIDGNIAMAVAAYNGGPGNVRRWKEAYGARDMDMFIERMPRDETRDYTKKVLLNFYAYRGILDQGPPR